MRKENEGILQAWVLKVVAGQNLVPCIMTFTDVSGKYRVQIPGKALAESHFSAQCLCIGKCKW